MSDGVAQRSAVVTRRTAETAINLKLALDAGDGPAERGGSPGVSTGCGFLDHLLCAMARHAGFALAVEAQGDQAQTGSHHLAEDTGLALGRALRYSLYGDGDLPTGESAPGVERFGHAIVPMDDALVLVAVDLSGRPGAYLRGLTAAGGGPACAGFEWADWAELCRGLATAGMFTLHIDVLAGDNVHHIMEAAAKALGRALGEAARLVAGGAATTSTKGRVALTVCPWR